MKKFTLFGIILSAAMLSSCNEYRDGDVTSVPEETTSLTLTVSLTETVPPPEPAPQAIELAVYNPFANTIKIDNNIKKELLDFSADIETARQLLQADWRIYDSDEYTDTENIVEGLDNDFQYKPFINADIADDEEKLFNYMRKFFTPSFISDEELQSALFEDYYSNPPRYKTIDGQLCIRSGYDGVMTKIDTDELWVTSYNENYINFVMTAHDVGYPPSHAFIGFEKSEQYGWRLDSLEFKGYDETFVRIYTTGLTEKYDTLNKILSGEVPENAAEFTDNGVRYVQTDLDMSVAEMKEFFENTFRPMAVTIDNRRSKLLEPYTEKYIDSVYLEREGVLYRAADAPRWYIPEDEFDPYNGYISASMGNGGRGDYIIREKFYDEATNIHFTDKIAISCDYSWSETENGDIEYKYYGIYIASELPIREKRGESFNEIIKSVIEKKKTELDLSDKPFGVTDIYSGTMFDYNNDGHDDYIFGYSLYAQFQLVIIDSQNGDILFDERIMTYLIPDTKMEIYRNDNSEYAIKISLRNEKPAVSHTDETIHIITASGEHIFEALYDYETGAFLKAYNNDYDEYTEEKYLQKQEELLEGYAYYADIDWTL